MARRKVCRACGKTKGQSEFYGHPLTADRLAPECMDCRSSYARAYYLRNRERLKAYHQEYRQRRKAAVT